MAIEAAFTISAMFLGQTVILLIILSRLKVAVSENLKYISAVESGLYAVREEFAELKGECTQFMKVPVLRQYIQRNVPVLLTAEQEKELKKREADHEAAFNKAFSDVIPPEELV